MGFQPVRKLTWGRDLGSVGVPAGNDHGGPASGRSSLDSAGGIGGLLAMQDANGTPTTDTDDLRTSTSMTHRLPRLIAWSKTPHDGPERKEPAWSIGIRSTG